MPSANSLLALAAILALPGFPASGAQVDRKNNLRKNNERRKLRRARIIDGGGGLEEDVAFYTNLIRRTQVMSVPTDPPASAPTDPPIFVGVPTDPPVFAPTDPPIVVGVPTDPPVFAPTDPPVFVGVPTDPPAPAPTEQPTVGGSNGSTGGMGGGGPLPTLPPQGVITNPPVPVAGSVCADGESCAVEGDACSDGSTEECCGEVFESFQCACADAGGDAGLVYGGCSFTDACLDRVCEVTGPPQTGDDFAPPTPTPPPVLDTGGFKCPKVECTAEDPSFPVDECSVIGEPCLDGNEGEFCCLDGCPRNYCTAKQALMSVSGGAATKIMPMPTDWAGMLDGLDKNDP